MGALRFGGGALDLGPMGPLEQLVGAVREIAQVRRGGLELIGVSSPLAATRLGLLLKRGQLLAAAGRFRHPLAPLPGEGLALGGERARLVSPGARLAFDRSGALTQAARIRGHRTPLL